LNKYDEVFSDCPHVHIFRENEAYSVEVWDWLPGPGAGDFKTIFNTIDEAFKEVIGYFFDKEN